VSDGLHADRIIVLPLAGHTPVARAKPVMTEKNHILAALARVTRVGIVWPAVLQCLRQWRRQIERAVVCEAKRPLTFACHHFGDWISSVK
jgi:hypothetical protein